MTALITTERSELAKKNPSSVPRKVDLVTHKRLACFASIVALLFFLIPGCASSPENTSNQSDQSAATLKDDVIARGVLRVATDPSYPPASSFDEATGKWSGYDVAVAEAVTKRLGVKVEWVTPSWDVITAGRWNGRWDLAVNSMAPTAEREKVLAFTKPYYWAQQYVAVRNDSSITTFDQLKGKRIGCLGGTSYPEYLEHKLTEPGWDIQYRTPEDVNVVTYDADLTPIQDVVLGRNDAVLSQDITLKKAIETGSPLRLLQPPVYFVPQSIAADKSGLDPTSLIADIDTMLNEMKGDGTLTALSNEYFGNDQTEKPE